MEDKNKLDERDFHHGEGHGVPLFLRIAWSIFFIAATTYLIKFMWPDLLIWLDK